MKRTIAALLLLGSLPLPQFLSAQIPSDELVAFYPFNGNANDASGFGNNGVVNGAALVADRFGLSGRSYSFNGVDNSIQVPHSSALVFATQQFTFTCWVKINSFSHQVIAFKGAATTSPGYYNEWAVVIEPDSTLRFKVNADSVNSIYSYLTSTPSLQLNKWSHVAAMWNGSAGTMKLYLDGQEVGSTGAISQIVSMTSQPLFLGFVGDGPLNGSLDDVRLYGQALDAVEIQELYNLERLDGGLAAHFPFNGNTNDESGNGNNLTINGATLTANRFGIPNRAYFFNGADNYMSKDTATFSFNYGSRFTVSAWFKHNATVGNQQIVSQMNLGSGNFVWTLETNWTEGNLNFGAAKQLTAWNLTNYPTAGLETGKWYHAVGVYDSLKIRLYFNGEIVDSTMFAYTNTLSAALPLTVGRKEAPNYFNGAIDDIRIYAKALTAGEIRDLYREDTISDESLIITDVPNDNGKQAFVLWETKGSPVDAGVLEFTVWRKDANNWTYLNEVSAIHDTVYQVVAPTIFDSTVSSGMKWSIFRVLGHTSNPNFYYVIGPDSGYSLDNLPPLAPVGGSILPTINGYIVSWKPAIDERGDFKEYALYRGATFDFIPSGANRLSYVSDTTYNDATAGSASYFYKVTSVDYSGNESVPLSIQTPIVGVNKAMDVVPHEYLILQNYPNPYNPSTTIQFGLPERSNVRIAVYNQLGQKVQIIIDQELGAGYHQVMWDAQAATGLYFCRIEAVSVSDPNKRFVETKKMILAK